MAKALKERSARLPPVQHKTQEAAYALTVPTPAINDLSGRIAECMLRDQPRLRERLRGLEKTPRSRHKADDSLARLDHEIAQSIAVRQERLAALPRPIFPPDLPIVQRRTEIAQAIAANQVVIVCGETGSGKTTQLPKICMELGRGVAGMIGHTQPRRIAARSVAARIASELGSSLGQAVGYKVRFNDKLSPGTYLKIMTDGILLAETQGDRDLLQYDTIIIDEAHERSLNIDFLLGYLKQLLPRRPELKVIITSATIDPQKFSRHFDDAPIIEVSGRSHPVEVRYRSVQADEADEEDPSILDAILNAVDEIEKTELEGSGPGDILIFLSGEREIREAAEALRGRCNLYKTPTQLLPLYARLSTEEQNRVFQPHEGRRIILATNVAETSLTVPGVRFVIDPGFARISRYSSNARVQRLPIERISRASADQRKGRCGRIAAGVCIRLYTQEDFNERSEFTDPEILRANLASVILQMKALKLGEIERFGFIEPPRLSMIREGNQTLHELGAVDDHGELTTIGRELAKLPIDPRLGRMILAARDEKCLREVLIIASALATQDPRLRPMDAPKLADAAHQQFVDERSDFLAYLKIWEFYHAQARELSGNKLRKLCQQNYLSYVRLREWHDVHRQLHALAMAAGMKFNDKPAEYEDIHRALLTGLLANIGFKAEGHEFHGVRDRKFNIFPGSSLFKAGPKWLVAAELVETTRLYARTVARVQPEWIEKLAGHLLKRTYTAPHWNGKSAHVEAYEKITLQGLVIVPKRRVHFGRINPELAREVFIHFALVEGEYEPHLGRHGPAGADRQGDSAVGFLQHNRNLLQELRTLEAKSRRRDVMVDSDVRYAFYDQRIPPGVFNGPLFEKWRRQAEQRDPHVLFMSREDLVRRDAPTADPEQFPDAIAIRGVRLPLRYELDPGQAGDGVTMIIPIEALNQVHEDRAQWLVPGMLREKVIALIKTLPKQLRRTIVPAPDYADACLRNIDFGEGNLLDQIGAKLGRMAETTIPREAWNTESLSDHLRMNFAVVDGEGRTLAAGRDLTAIKKELGERAARQLSSSLQSEFDRAFVTTWDFGNLAERLEFKRGSAVLYGYPTVIDQGDHVRLTLLDTAEGAGVASRAGVRRLFVLQVAQELAAHVDYLPNIDELCLRFAPLGDGARFKRDLIDLIADRVFLGDLPEVRTQIDFERRLRGGWNNLWPAASEISGLIGRILEAHHDLDLRLADIDNPLFASAVKDIEMQLCNLMPAHFLVSTPFQWLLHFPRYLQAIVVRLRKLGNAALARDGRAIDQAKGHWDQCQLRRERHQVHGTFDPALEKYRWMIEELRVSLFAQELGTSVPVSPKRMEQQWSQVRP